MFLSNFLLFREKTSRVIEIRNLGYNVKAEDIRNECLLYGQIDSFHLIFSENDGYTAEVKFVESACAEKAYNSLIGRTYFDNQLCINLKFN